MKKSAVLGLLMLAAGSHNAFAQGWTEALTIQTLHTGHSSTNFFIYTTGPSGGIPACPHGSTRWQFRSGDASQDRQKRTYAAILLALATSKRVNLFTIGCVDGYQTFDAVQVLNQ